MRFLGAPWLLVCTVMGPLACHGPGTTASPDNSIPPGKPVDTAATATATIDLGEGPGGEIVPGLAMPPQSEGAPTAAPGSSAPNPSRVERQEQLFEGARRALDEDRPNDALAMIDVLVVLDPEDPEAIELRARTLERLGDRDGSRADLERCCKLGRSSCCR